MAQSENKTSPVELTTDFLRRVAQTLSFGVAIVKMDTWEILFENATFFKWFPPVEDPDETLSIRVRRFKPDRAISRLEGGRAYTFETATSASGRDVPLSVDVRAMGGEDEGLIVLEVQDTSKLKQSEYLLESYSKMAEKNAREVEREKDRVERLLLNVPK